MLRSPAALLVPAVLVAALALTGCTASTAPAPPSDAASGGTATTTPSSSTSTADGGPALGGGPAGDGSAGAPQDVACSALLDPSTIATWKSHGIVAITSFQGGKGYPDFAQYGGQLCQFGVPDSDSSIVVGYGPISVADATTEQAALAKTAIGTTKADDGSSTYILGALDGSDAVKQVVQFGAHGYWAYSSGELEGLGSIDEIVGNAPAF